MLLINIIQYDDKETKSSYILNVTFVYDDPAEFIQAISI